ncbi:hypothetical protein SO3561_09568 [Streptomyces olivochromogenes]|uniref:Uncharacterized protein n=1 Tax=Streptomyces olivochromogenes TaxID=1963 RepID=A0A250VUU5_STROL|nr:hypothetical protein SO3561_09568 [Streptomyces olivochromogenes]
MGATRSQPTAPGPSALMRHESREVPLEALQVAQEAARQVFFAHEVGRRTGSGRRHRRPHGARRIARCPRGAGGGSRAPPSGRRRSRRAPGIHGAVRCRVAVGVVVGLRGGQHCFLRLSTVLGATAFPRGLRGRGGPGALVLAQRVLQVSGERCPTARSPWPEVQSFGGIHHVLRSRGPGVYRLASRFSRDAWCARLRSGAWSAAEGPRCQPVVGQAQTEGGFVDESVGSCSAVLIGMAPIASAMRSRPGRTCGRGDRSFVHGKEQHPLQGTYPSLFQREDMNGEQRRRRQGAGCSCMCCCPVLASRST